MAGLVDPPGLVHDDPVELPRGVDGHLPGQDVLEHGRRIAHERGAEASAARRPVTEAVAAVKRQRRHRHRRDIALDPVDDGRVPGRSARQAALEAVGRVETAVRPDRQGRALGPDAVLALVREPAATLPGAAGVGDESVLDDLERQVALEQLDRLVRQVGERVRDSLEPVAGRAGAPGADDDLRRPEGPTVLVVAAERDERRAALAGGDDPVRHDLGEGAHDRVVTRDSR